MNIDNAVTSNFGEKVKLWTIFYNSASFDCVDSDCNGRSW